MGESQGCIRGYREDLKHEGRVLEALPGLFIFQEGWNMRQAAKSILVFGIYMVLAGLGFLADPNMPLALFGFPTTNEPWIRAVGLLIIILLYYYIQAARGDVTPFFRWTVHARSFVLVCFIVLVIIGMAKPMVIGFGVVDFLGAIWTGLALRRMPAENPDGLGV
jgi:hypothetical protein